MELGRKHRTIFFYVIIVLLLLFNNLLLPQINTVEYSFNAFSSDFYNIGEAKTVSDGAPGYLAFGPYISCGSGPVHVELFYECDTAGNKVEIYSDEHQQVYEELELPVGQNRVIIKANLPNDLKDMEIRVRYNGTGSLSLDKVRVSERLLDLYIIIAIYDVVLLVAAVMITVFAVRKKENHS